MLEIPEVNVLSKQMNDVLKGKRVARVLPSNSPHKFTWFFDDDPAAYDARLKGKVVGETIPCGGRLETQIEDMLFHVGDGVVLRYLEPGEPLPKKYQLVIQFDDDSALVCTVAMYGGIWVFAEGEFDNEYYRAAKEAISPLGEVFTYEHFLSLRTDDTKKLSAKAFLATEQRIPGLGNGVLQDILLQAKINPRTKMNTLSEAQMKQLYTAVKEVLQQMTQQGGRDTEKDLYGNFGGYRLKLSKNTYKEPCRDCGGEIKKENYLGGSIYYCETCQPRP